MFEGACLPQSVCNGIQLDWANGDLVAAHYVKSNGMLLNWDFANSSGTSAYSEEPLAKISPRKTTSWLNVWNWMGETSTSNTLES